MPRNTTNIFTVKVSLSGTIKLVREAIKCKPTYNGQGIAFDEEGPWNFYYDFVKNVVIFGVNNSSLSRTDNRKNNFLVLGEGLTQGVNGSTDAAEKIIVLTLVKQMQNSA